MKKNYKILGLLIIISLMIATFGGCLSLANGKGSSKEDINGGQNMSPPIDSMPNNEEEVGYTITFVTNNSAKVDPIKTLNLTSFPADPTIKNFLFAGWFLDNTLIERVTLPFVPTKNTNFYAKWVPEGSIKIKSYEDFLEMGKAMVGNYILETDIVLADDFVPFGKSGIPFKGNLDGGGYKIKNLVQEPLEMNTQDFSQNCVGLFASLNGNVSNLIIEDAKITLRGDLYNFDIGLLCGQLLGGTITNVKTSGTIINPKIIYDEGYLDDFVGSYAKPTRNSYFGGIAGVSENANIIKSNSAITITSETNSDKVYIGGLVGHLKSGTVSESNAYSTIKGKIVGGLVGYSNGTIFKSYAIVDLKGDLLFPSVIGGITAYNFSNATLDRSYATGKIEGKSVGGLVGVNEKRLSTDTGAKITNCYSNVALYGSEYAGGLVARVKLGEITNCISYGKVEADNGIWQQDPMYPNDPSKLVKKYLSDSPTFAGGLVAESFEGTYNNCIAFGNVTALSKSPAETFNAAYATNGIGLSSSVNEGIYGVVNQFVKRNNRDYNVGNNEFNSSPILTVAQLNSYAFLTSTLNFNDTIWNLVGISVEQGIFPTLK